MYDNFSNVTNWIQHLYSGLPGWASSLIDMVLIATLFLAFFALLGLLLVWMERKIAGFFQLRLGPNRIGPWGIFQTTADTLKLLMKETVGTKDADSLLYNLAPYFLIVTGLMAMSVMPYGIGMLAYDIDIGVFFVIAISSIGVIGILLAGWSSNNKYAMIGAMRSGAQIVSYELSVGLSVLTMILLTGSLQMSEIVQSQEHLWLIFQGHIPALIAFVIFIISGTAESNRVPFDLVEAESELGAGFHTEYSGIKFAFFFLSEFVNMFIMTAMATVIFFGGWMPFHIPGLDGFNHIMNYIPSFIWFFGKVTALIFLIMWFRWTFPRLRIDQILTLEWKYLLPINLVNILVMAFLVLMGWHL